MPLTTPPVERYYTAGRYLYPTGCRLWSANIAMVQNTMRCVRLVLPCTVTIASLGFVHGTNVAGSTYHMGVYTDTGQDYPDALVGGTSVSTASGSGVVRTIALSSNITIGPGPFWLVGVSRGGDPTIGRCSTAAADWDFSLFPANTTPVASATFPYNVGYLIADGGGTGLTTPFPAIGGASALSFGSILPLIFAVMA